MALKKADESLVTKAVECVCEVVPSGSHTGSLSAVVAAVVSVAAVVVAGVTAAVPLLQFLSGPEDG